MRILLIAILGTACGGGASGGEVDAPGGEGGGGGGLPTPHCGQGFCSECVGCGVNTSLCFGAASRFSIGSGQCTASPAAGTFEVMVDGVAFVTDQAAAVMDGSYVEIVARSGDQAIALLLPAAPGTYDCGSAAFGGVVTYFRTAAAGFYNRLTMPRPACIVTVTGVGPVGGRIEGSFSATVTGSGASVQLTAGTFSVERVAYP